MPFNDQQNSNPSETGYSTAQLLAMTTVSTIAVGYGAYKIIGRFFDSTAPLFDTTQLCHWKNLGPTRALVHAVQSRYRNSSPLFKFPAEDVIRTWDIISTSLIDTRLTMINRWNNERYTGLGDAVGLILDCPPQNILGTHPYDVSFPNHSQNLVKDFLLGRSKSYENELKHPHYNLLMSPDELLAKRRKYFFCDPEYNEVLIVGKANVNIYKAYATTKRPTIRGILLFPDAANGVASGKELHTAQALKVVNPNLPVYAVKNKNFVILIE